MSMSNKSTRSKIAATPLGTSHSLPIQIISMAVMQLMSRIAMAVMQLMSRIAMLGIGHREHVCHGDGSVASTACGGVDQAGSPCHSRPIQYCPFRCNMVLCNQICSFTKSLRRIHVLSQFVAGALCQPSESREHNR